MVFSDLLFIFAFLPFFILTYLAGTWIDRRRINREHERGEQPRRPMLWRNASLIIFSVVFYSWGEPVYVLLMLFAVVINYGAGLLIHHLKGAKSRKAALITGVTLDLAILGSFKYLGFFAETLSWVFAEIRVPDIALPIGISFYIFQSISYLVDVYRKESPVQKNFFDLLLYIAMFPQLIAGPIVRYGSVAEEIHNRSASMADISEGTYRFFIGLGKKVIFANILGETATQLIGGDLGQLSVWGAWGGIIAFSLQIYFDFSGYSDMAIGLGRSVGFHFPENFSHPYTCTSMTDFWRRWHMSLGSFFRDYVYIPMGGNRRHQLLNIMTVWFLTGMWHGASWNFILWGLYFGLIITIEKYTLLRWRIPRVFRHIYAIFIILVGWGLFYFDDMGKLQQFYQAMFDFGGFAGGVPPEVASPIYDNFWLIVAALVLCLPVRTFLSRRSDAMALRMGSTASYTLQFTRALISAVILACCIVLLVGATNNAFIYTRF